MIACPKLYIDNIAFVDPIRVFSFRVVDGLTRDEIHLNIDGVKELANVFTVLAANIPGNWKRHHSHHVNM